MSALLAATTENRLWPALRQQTDSTLPPRPQLYAETLRRDQRPWTQKTL